MRPVGRAARTAAVAAWVVIVGSGVGTDAADGQEPWRIAELRRVGEPELRLGQLTDVALDGAGRLWLADGQAGEVWVVEGEVPRRIATAGRGPGEITAGPIELVAVGGDTVLIVEPHAARFLVATASSGFVREVRLSGAEGLTSGWRAGRAGELLAREQLQTVVRPDRAPTASGDPIAVFDRSGRRVRTAAVLPAAESFRMGPGGRPTITLLGAQPVWTVDADGRVLEASTALYAVRVHDGGGSRTVVAADVSAASVDRRLAERARELLAETLRGRRMPESAVAPLVGAAAVAAEAPALGGLLAGPDRTIWVRAGVRRAEELTDLERPGGTSWRIYGEDGVPVGSAELPPGFEPAGWRNDLLFGVLRDELGRTSALVLRATRPGA